MTRDNDHGELRTLLLLLALAVSLLVTGTAVFLAVAYPRLAEPLAAGAAVLTCLAGLARTVAAAARERR
ncbi:hypothetical protein OG311_02500 [Streptomyces sp. NBC_01343]|uniref:hypothetical protein n=1 Tax=Streptomyces sp. NBC_01343 TaxID=2903832 RepID=UPI002E0D240C|nr:hypothetical protein OG311_02500 [Streptomyces sp. NBC_01343]